MTVRLRSRRVVCPEGTRPATVVIEGGRIAAVDTGGADGGEQDEAVELGEDAEGVGLDERWEVVDRGERAEVVDLGERWLVPGYIDGHVHGGGGAQCNTTDAAEVAAMAGFHARHGTTGLLATTVAAPLDELRAAVDTIAACTAPNVLGVHLEGPFLSPRRPGAMDPDLFLEPDPGGLERLLEPGDARLMTLAPELPGALELIERLAHAGVVASVGHTCAGDADVRAAVRAGARAATHIFNAMPPFHHRDPGTVGAVLDAPEISCELICDGVHVDPVAMRLVYRAKGAAGLRLVTDAMAAAGMPDGEYRLGGRPVTVEGGRAVLKGGGSIAGSTLTMEAAVQNAVRLLHVPVEEAVRMASANPARLLGLERQKGEIMVGLDADLVVLDERLAVEATMIAGEWVFGAP